MQVDGGGLDAYGHTCARKTDDTLWCWGDNGTGQIGDGSTTVRSSPVQIAGDWTWISCGGQHTCGRKSDGSLWCWGANGGGPLGDGTQTTRHVPTPVTGMMWALLRALGGDGAWGTRRGSARPRRPARPR